MLFFRPLQIHYSPSQGFMNDPNGLVISGPPENRTIHLYYQYNPTALVAGNQHWGHATSSNFSSYAWQNHLPAIAPGNSSEGIFSGSAVIDANNTSGFFNDSTAADDRIIAIYTLNTAEEQTQNIAYSLDGGYTYTKYEGNPVLSDSGEFQTQFRDPKVFWDTARSQWVMAVAHAQQYEVGFYTSPDLKGWTEASRFSLGGILGYQYECPDLFPVTMVGGPQDGQTTWVLLVSINPGWPPGGSGSQYFMGDWDGTTFNPKDRAARLADFGKDWYAAQTWSNVPDNKTMIIAWVSTSRLSVSPSHRQADHAHSSLLSLQASNWQYTNSAPTASEGWRSSMSVPREVTLRYAALNPLFSDYQLAMMPINTTEIVDSEVFSNGSSANATSSATNGTSAVSAQTIQLENAVGAYDVSASFSISADAATNATASSFAELRIYASANGSRTDQYLRVGLVGGSQGGVYIDRRRVGGTWADDSPFYTDRFSSYVQPRYSSNDTTTADQLWDLRLIIDRSLVEVFVNEGVQSAAVLTFWDQGALPDALEVVFGDGSVRIDELQVLALKSGWLEGC